MKPILMAFLLLSSVSPAFSATSDTEKLREAIQKDPEFQKLKASQETESKSYAAKQKIEVETALKSSKDRSPAALEKIRANLKSKHAAQLAALRDRHLDAQNKFLAVHRERLLKAAP